MTKVGPFFVINNNFFYNAIKIEHAENRDGKLDNPYSHEKLFDDYFQSGDYIDYPRGRVIYDSVNNEAIIYIDKCINNSNVIKMIIKVFKLENYIIEYDLHYHCKDCINEIIDDL